MDVIYMHAALSTLKPLMQCIILYYFYYRWWVYNSSLRSLWQSWMAIFICKDRTALLHDFYLQRCMFYLSSLPVSSHLQLVNECASYKFLILNIPNVYAPHKWNDLQRVLELDLDYFFR